LAVHYFFHDEDPVKEIDFEKMLNKATNSIAKYNTILNHLESLPETWEYLQQFFIKSITPPDLTHSEINFGEFRRLTDFQCKNLYVTLQDIKNRNLRRILKMTKFILD